MRSRWLRTAAWWAGLVAAGCGGSSPAAKGAEEPQPAAGPVATSSAPIAPEPAAPPPAAQRSDAGLSPTAATPPADDMMASSAAQGADAGPPPAQNVVKLCEQMCDRMVSKRCSAVSVQACRANCARYAPPASCDDEIRSAFECARDAQDLQCAYIVPGSCSNKFRRLVACSRGEKLDIPADKPAIPEGWERYSTKTGGFTVTMPRGVTEKSVGALPTFSSEQGPVSYSVQIQPRPEDPPTQKNLVKLAIRMFGDTCGRKLRLHGMVEQDGKVAIRYDTECRDNTERHGMFYVTAKQMYVLTVSSPKGTTAERDTFLYGFSMP